MTDTQKHRCARAATEKDYTIRLYSGTICYELYILSSSSSVEFNACVLYIRWNNSFGIVSSFSKSGILKREKKSYGSPI